MVAQQLETTAVVEESVTAPEKRRFSIPEYYLMAETGVLRRGERVELIEGEIIALSPIGVRHANMVRRLNKMLNAMVGDHATVDAQNPVRIGSASEPQPDIVLLEHENYEDTHPVPSDVLLLIEVSDTTLIYDRDTKVPLYARSGIREVWIVNLNARLVLRYTDPRDGRYRLLEQLSSDDQIETQLLPSLTLTIQVKDILR